MRRLTDEQRLAWLQLIRSENVGPVTFRDLINHYGGAEAALDALPELSNRGGKGRPIRLARIEDIKRELARARKLGSDAVSAGEPGYPPWLEHIDAPPPIIYVQGEKALAGAPIVAIVGSRDGSAAGRKFARTLAANLGAAGYVVASGLARGIDGEAHTAALDTGTIAVVAGGIDIIYPPEHGDLQREIARRGLLISERPPGLPPKGQDFPRRNRIISGISRGVVIVEAAKRSGSLITARLAGEQGREVFAVPGHPLDPRAVGTNRLLKQGATMVTSAKDILEILTPLDDRADIHPPRGLFDTSGHDDPPEAAAPEISTVKTSDRERVVEALGTAPVEIDEICRSTRLDIRNVRIVLVELDLAGRLERHNNQLVSLKLTG